MNLAYLQVVIESSLIQNSTNQLDSLMRCGC
jgi:hypothetical protein